MDLKKSISIALFFLNGNQRVAECEILSAKKFLKIAKN